jgi:uncharacterized membrane protein YfcA
VSAGAFSGLTGVGGGSIMVPLLTGWLKLGQHRAHGTSLAIITFVAVAGVLGYWHAGNVDWRLVAALTPGAMLGVYAGARAMVKVPAPQLKLLFGMFLFFVAFRQLAWDVSAGAPQSGAVSLLIEAAVGFAGGLLAGVLGVGGGAIFVPAIVILGLAGEAETDPQKVAQGVSLVVIIATGLVGTVTNLRQDTVDAGIARGIALPAMAAALMASLFANRLDDAVLERIYGVVALVLACETVFTAVRAMRAASSTAGGPLTSEV